MIKWTLILEIYILDFVTYGAIGQTLIWMFNEIKKPIWLVSDPKSRRVHGACCMKLEEVYQLPKN